MLSYGVTEESGGPGVAAAGFATGLARLGAEVWLFALESRDGTWLVDQRRATTNGFRFVHVKGRNLASRTVNLLREVRKSRCHEGQAPTVIWVNGVWGAQTVAGGLIARLTGWPLIVRPAGSLGTVALGYHRLKKKVYYSILESRVIRAAAAIHCMSEKERDELSPVLQPRTFIVPSGIGRPAPLPPQNGASRTLGVLARLHPIKNHQRVLDALEQLLSEGYDLDLELAGSTSDTTYERELRQRVNRSGCLRDRVRFLGHVPADAVSEVAGRWRAALLLSEQENFGHAVVAAASAGIPTVVSPGVALGRALEAGGAGVIVAPERAATALRQVLSVDAGEWAVRCRAFATKYSWEGCSRQLLDRFSALVPTKR